MKMPETSSKADSAGMGDQCTVDGGLAAGYQRDAAAVLHREAGALGDDDVAIGIILRNPILDIDNGGAGSVQNIRTDDVGGIDAAAVGRQQRPLSGVLFGGRQRPGALVSVSESVMTMGRTLLMSIVPAVGTVLPES